MASRAAPRRVGQYAFQHSRSASRTSSLLAQAKALRETPPLARELDRAKSQIEAAYVFSQDSMFYRALILGTYELAGGWQKADDYLPSIRAVTAEDVQRAAATWLGEKNRTVGILLPEAPPTETETTR